MPVLIICGCAAAIGMFVIAALWIQKRRGRRKDQAEPANRFISIVLLLSKPRVVTRAEFDSACERGLGLALGTTVVYLPPPPGRFVLRRGETGLALITVDKPYVENQGSAAEQTRLFELKQLLLQHRAWLSIDLLGKLPSGGHEEAYRWVGKLVAEFLDEDCIGVFCVETQLMNVVRSDTFALLRGPEPMKAFEYQNPNTTIGVPVGDAELAAAEEEARRR